MKRTYLIGLSCFAAFLLFACYGFTAQSNNAAASESAPVTVGGESAVLIEQICSKITEGDFAGAREFLERSDKSKSTAITRLVDVISEYEATEEKRRAARKH